MAPVLVAWDAVVEVVVWYSSTRKNEFMSRVVTAGLGIHCLD